MAVTNHHILFERYLWDARPESRCLRRSSGLIVKLAEDNHSALHRACTSVPVPNIYMLRTMRAEFVPSGDILQGIDNLCFAIESAANHPRAKDIDKRLGEIMVDSVRMQIPFLEK